MATCHGTATTVTCQSSGTWNNWVDNTSDTSATGNTWTTWSTTSTTTADMTCDSTASNTVWYRWCGEGITEEYIPLTIEFDASFAEWDHQQEKKLGSMLFARIQELYESNQKIINREWAKILAAELKAAKEAAEDKAKALLLDLVSEREFAMYEKTGKLLVKGRKYNYIVSKEGYSVRLRGKGKKLTATPMCVHLNYKDRNKCPPTDNVIALKLNMENNEKQFLKTANHHGPRIPSPVEFDVLEAVNE